MAGFRETYIRSYYDYVTATAATLAGASAAIADVGIAVPQNYLIRILRCSVFSNSSGTPTFELFVNHDLKAWQAQGWAPDRTRRVHFATSGKNDPGDFNQPPMFDEGQIPTAFWSGTTNGDICQACFLIAIFQKDLLLTVRDQRAMHHQEQIEQYVQDNTVPLADENLVGSLEYPAGLVQDALYPWASSENLSEDPGFYTPPGEGMGQYVGDAYNLGAQHPLTPFYGRVLPDHSRDHKGSPE